ncbi:prephenate dehydratase [Marinigracilibium pacificum]|uniref:Bifunctional chorismate mutase/prephenate dehydratase n=1 Tax=Marinigracilibium pacificum TaxID=2729599 RepID=A0A848IRH0_9BACT|nr:prephenate dehydratase [Marinigracilibium pacificum]
MKLDELRSKIDKLDDQILDLMNERMEIVKQVGELKRSSNSIIYRPEREKAIIDRLTKRSNGLMERQAIEAIFLEIFAISRNMELPERVAYLGPEGSFTHQAAESRFGAINEYLSIGSISSVFETVNTGRARFGVVPVENNQEGIVQETIDLIGRYDLKIVAEIPMSIHFSFATLEEKISDIKKIYSKDIAFRQCRNFLTDLFGDQIELIPVNSTSTAVKIAKEEPNAAAICSHIAAKEYGLPILFENIEDSDSNHTRFWIIARDIINQQAELNKTSLIAKLPDTPGSLASFLEAFHNAEINLSKVESRPAKIGKKFKYWFFVEFDGHFNDDKVQEALAPYLKNVKWLGSYVKLC